VRRNGLPPISVWACLDSIRSIHSNDNLQRDTSPLDLWVAVSEDGWELALDDVFKSNATRRLRSIFLKDMLQSHELLDLFEAIISSGAVDLPLLSRIEIQFDEIEDIDYRKTKAIDTLAPFLSMIPTLSELYWHSENYISHDIPWSQFKTIFLYT
jgi:hypothetical protein